MPQKSNLNVALLLFLLMFGIYWKHSAEGGAHGGLFPPDGRGVDGSAFFALRSCHQLLRSDSGEFFSPEYLCSNPPLWCNWTIQVDPGKRIHLHLEDLTPDEACQAKQDQIHVDDPAGQSGGEHKVLQKCWQEAKYTSSSNILQVVLLIGGWPSSSYRGFYGRYQAFGPPVVYNPREEGGIRSKESEVEPGLTKFSDPSVNSEQTGPEMMYDYYDPATMAERPWESKCGFLIVSWISLDLLGRLNAGALYILWLQIGQGPGGGQVHRAVHSAMQGLLSSGVNLRVNRKNAIIMSVSTADVNECGTNLVLCDANADCVNHFGSYSCHCREGFKDESRLGSGGTICTDQKTTDCSSGLSSETKGVYILFFLLSSLILMLVAVAGTLYHRHHRGAFLVRCHNSGSISPPDSNNNHLHHEDHYSSPADSDLPPPPPPARGSRDSWAPGKERRLPVDLPLLRFSPLLPPDSYIDPQDGGKM
uniref:EGF-like domain-containing protein n=1 Tax=Oryzias sinensis TaxID=183150 RepID=A0A8C8A0R9_9TELE